MSIGLYNIGSDFAQHLLHQCPQEEWIFVPLAKLATSRERALCAAFDTQIQKLANIVMKD